MNKKTIVTLVLIILLSFGAGTLLLVAKQKSQTVVKQEPVKAEIKKLVDEVSVSPIRSFDGSAIWYFNPTGRLFRVNLDGSGLTEYPLPALPQGRLSEAMWPEQRSDFIVSVLTNFGEVKYYYDNAQKKYVELPEAVQNLDWMPDGKRILYVWKSGDNAQQLKLAGADSSGFSTITDLFWPDYAVKVSPDGQEALVYRSRPIGDINKIFIVDIKTGRFEPIVEDGRNSGAIWVPGGEKFVFSQLSPTGTFRLLMYNFSNHRVVDLNLATTINKISIDQEGKTLYAAVSKPDNLGEEFVKLDLVTLKQESYYQPQQDIRIKNLLEIKGKLYFVNLIDSKLYYITK